MIVTAMHRTITKKDMTDIIMIKIKNKDSCFPGTVIFDDLVEVVSGLRLTLRGNLFLFVADSIFIESRVTSARDGEDGEEEVEKWGRSKIGAAVYLFNVGVLFSRIRGILFAVVERI